MSVLSLDVSVQIKGIFCIADQLTHVSGVDPAMALGVRGLVAGNLINSAGNLINVV